MSEVLYVRIVIDRDSAIRAGRAEYGPTYVEVDPSSLSPDQREELIRCPAFRTELNSGYISYADPYRVSDPWNDQELSLPPVPDASMASLATLLDARPAALAAYEEKFRAHVEHCIQKALNVPPEEWPHDRVPGLYGAYGTYRVRKAVEADPRIAERLKAAKARYEEQLKREKAEREARIAAEEAAKQAAVAEKRAWIEAHGSPRLKRLLEEGIEHDAVYRDERLAHDFPGWTWEEDICDEGGKYKLCEPRNAPEEALDLLDRARQTVPDATLAYYIVYRQEDDDDDGDVIVERGYVAKANFLGRTIITSDRVVL